VSHDFAIAVKPCDGRRGQDRTWAPGSTFDLKPSRGPVGPDMKGQDAAQRSRPVDYDVQWSREIGGLSSEPDLYTAFEAEMRSSVHLTYML
jgi:hypothetical protein